jgi:hypothetical protein
MHTILDKIQYLQSDRCKYKKAERQMYRLKERDRYTDKNIGSLLKDPTVRIVFRHLIKQFNSLWLLSFLMET